MIFDWRRSMPGDNIVSISKSRKGFVTVQPDGNLSIPEEAAQQFGLRPGTRTYLEMGSHGLLIHRPATTLARVNVEPTNACNLECRTCVRHVWDEPRGMMSRGIYEQILKGIQAFETRPMVFFGGFGEPLTHPEILTMVSEAHEAGARTELITNGILLDGAMARGLIKAGLDFLWVSIDGATPESYLDVRLGNELPGIIENLRQLRRLCFGIYNQGPMLGIAFVAMKRNLHDLPEVVRLGHKLGANKFHVSNVLPYTEEMQTEALYDQSLWESNFRFERVTIPRMDALPELLSAWEKLLRRSDWQALMKRDFNKPFDTCPFIEQGSVSIRWDGKVSPCLPLLHPHESYLGQTHRKNQAYFVGSLEDESLKQAWENPQHVRLRERLQEFDFSPCTICSSCEMVEGNEEDCFGNELPTCGGCLWAQGFIRCP